MRTSRRFFMASAASALTLAAKSGGRSVRGKDRIRIGIIGCGGRAGSHLDECLAKREEYGVEIRALCDVWKLNLDAMAGKVKEKTGHKPKTYTRYADLLASRDVDAVFITTPDFAHCPILVDAAKAKKHAYVEKPMGARLEDVNAAVDAVTASGIVCQVGTQRRSEGRHIAAAQLIQSGALGKMIKADCAWNDNQPRWDRPYDQVRREDVDWDQYLMYLPKRDFDPRMFRCWHLYRDCTVGLVGLLGSHLIDVALWYLDDPVPQSTVTMGAKIVWMNREHDDTQECLFQMPKGCIVQYTSRLGNSATAIGAENVFFGTNGTFDTKTWTARGEGGGKGALKEPVKVPEAPPSSHIANWIDCIRAGNVKTNADVRTGWAHSVASIMSARAAATGRRMVFDAAKREITEG